MNMGEPLQEAQGEPASNPALPWNATSAIVRVCLTCLKQILKMRDFLRKLGGQCKEDYTHCDFMEDFKISKLSFWRHPLYYENLHYRNFRNVWFCFQHYVCNIDYLRTYFQNENNIDKMLKLFSSSKAWFLPYIICNLSKRSNLWKI